MYPLLQGLGRPQTILQTAIFGVMLHHWVLLGAQRPTIAAAEQRSTRNGYRFHKRKEKQKTPTKSGQSTIEVLPSLKLTARTSQVAGPQKEMTVLHLPKTPVIQVRAVSFRECRSFITLQVMLGGFPCYTERNSCLVRWMARDFSVSPAAQQSSQPLYINANATVYIWSNDTPHVTSMIFKHK